MRLFFPIAGFAIAALSIFLDWQHVTPDSWYCRSGLCRFDQVFATPIHSSDVVSDLAALLNEDPLNPMVWSTYAEQLSAQGRDAEASAAFERAVSLGPNMSRVLIRAAIFDFDHDRADRGFRLANRILRQTDEFDQDFLYYVDRSGATASTVLATAVPPTPRAARFWLRTLRTDGSDRDLLETWSWMKKNRLTDRQSAVDLAWALWQKGSFQSAQALWVEWLGPADEGYLHPYRLANARFEKEPDGSPFDWTLPAIPSLEISRRDGLDVRFLGAENVDLTEVSQFATVKPGRYHLAAEISADGITTDEGPFFHVFDPTNPTRFSAQTAQVKGSVAKSWLSVDFQVPPGTEALQVRLERRPSLRFDSKIGGDLHVYQVFLVPAS